jgi:hypothetical protein
VETVGESATAGARKVPRPELEPALTPAGLRAPSNGADQTGSRDLAPEPRRPPVSARLATECPRNVETTKDTSTLASWLGIWPGLE